MRTKRISEAISLANELDLAVHGKEMRRTERSQLAGAVYSISLTHFSGIAILLHNDRVASAMALLRVQHEATIFGHWLEICADERQLVQLIEDGAKPEIEKMLKSLAKSELADGSAILRDAYIENKKAYNGHAHAGMLPISRMFDDGYITEAFSEEEIEEAVISAGYYALLSALGVSRLLDDQALADELLTIFKAWCK